MPVLKSRPEIRVLLPLPLRAGGGAFEAIVELSCEEEVPVDEASLEFWLTAGPSEEFRLRALLLDQPTVLEPGVHRLATRFALDRKCPQSYEGELFSLRYLMQVHVDIPWWPDARASFRVPVIDSDERPIERRSIVYVSHTGGPKPGGGPYVELAIDDPVVVLGEPLLVTVALGNVGHHAYRRLEFELVARETLEVRGFATQRNDRVVDRQRLQLPSAPVELEPFRCELRTTNPALCPGFHHDATRLDWILRVRARTFDGGSASTTADLQLRRDLPEGDAGEVVPIVVGSDRLDLVWQAVARKRGLELREGALGWTRGDVEVRVARTPLAGGGAEIEAALDFPDLGLGLGLDRAGHVRRLRSRFPSQLGRLFAHRQTILRTRGLTQANDRGLRLTPPGAGHDVERLDDFLAFLDSLAQMIHRRRRLLLPPPGMDERVERWQAAARRLEGELRQADMRIRVERSDLIVDLACVWSARGEFLYTALELTPSTAIPRRHHMPMTPGRMLGRGHSELGLEELLALRPDADTSVRISARSVRLSVDELLDDPLVERERVEALFGLGWRLQSRSGPYR